MTDQRIKIKKDLHQAQNGENRLLREICSVESELVAKSEHNRHEKNIEK
jgi:hypothetical protein